MVSMITLCISKNCQTKYDVKPVGVLKWPGLDIVIEEWLCEDIYIERVD